MRNWHYKISKVNRSRYLNWGAGAMGFGAGALAGGGALSVPLAVLGGAAGLFSDSMQGQTGTEDVLGPIRARLMALADKVPGITAQRAEDIKAQGADYEKTGLKNIAEDLYASRGLGPTSIQGNYNLDFLKNLHDSIQSALTQNEYQGLQEQSNILTGASGVVGTPDQASPLAGILGGGASLLGKNAFDTQGTSGLSGILDRLGLGGGNAATTTTPGKVNWSSNIEEILKNTPGVKSFGAPAMAF